MKTLNVAIIGQGRSGRDIHGRYFHTDTKRYQVVAIVDAIAERRQRAATEFQCDTYADYTELLHRTDLDLVINASFSHQHYDITLDLLHHGFNVLVEKPCAASGEQLMAMAQAAEEHHCMLAFFQQSRFAPYYEKIQSILQSGVLGRILQIDIRFNGYARRWDWQCCQDMMGGSLYNTGPHPVDQALDLLDYRDALPNVLCRMDRANTFGDAEDYVKLILTAPDRPLIDVEISSCDGYPENVYRIQGTRGSLKGNLTQLDWKYFIENEAPPQTLIRKPLSTAEGLPAYCGEQLIWNEESWKSPDARVFTYAVRKVYDNIYDHLCQGQPLIVTPQQVAQQLDVIQECHRQNPLSKTEY